MLVEEEQKGFRGDKVWILGSSSVTGTVGSLHSATVPFSPRSGISDW